jgi:hypothetical protein
MQTLHNVHEKNAYGDGHVRLSARMCQAVSLNGFDETYYERFVTGDRSRLVNFNF